MVLLEYVILSLFFKSFKCSKMEPYIVGGDYTKIDNFPHSVFLAAACKENQWICGSSVLNQRLLLTAAHCLHGCPKKFIIDTFAGNSNLEKVTVIIRVGRLAIHDNYNEHTVYADIALAWLSSELPLGNNIKRVIISSNFPAGLKDAQVAGWGIVNDVTGAGTTRLKRVKQQVKFSRSCAATVGKLKNGMMCAGSLKRDHRPSEGDSGSALVTDSYEQIGLVSFRGNDAPDLIIYTNVSYFYSWIKKMSKVLRCKNN